MTEQERLIGKHPEATHILGEWLIHMDQPTTVSKKHRKLEENYTLRRKAIEQIAEWIIEHHIIEQRLEALERKARILQKYDFDHYVESLSLLPSSEVTKKGNVAEIILVEYLKECSGYSQIIHKLRYNTNVEQAMKGDDVLLLNPNNVFEKVIYGESKFRSTPNKQAIEDAVSNLEGNKKLPVSIGFVADRLYEMGNSVLADELMDLQNLLKENRINVHNVGFLLSTKSATPSKDAATQVEKHLDTSNPNLIFISLGLSNPDEIVDESFKLAKERLLSIK
ncbi:Hachiman antiphage defense system protein HamA [Parabacteroides bouchesdurhonensis]|uniref:Hachiman antiphage defense system protein HamA n=1 Tax=Parabacteroides bouchesdurhonensis TaxID=1936995 RepID=UPI000E4B6E87|nr:Hachiman antiphage defense system protein HamA [Parabacteroides bouchesdurhonensis]RHJ95073.1 DUF1837 domain-containing protein [Bacteroides sp. AM07-16]